MCLGRKHGGMGLGVTGRCCVRDTAAGEASRRFAREPEAEARLMERVDIIKGKPKIWRM